MHRLFFLIFIIVLYGCGGNNGGGNNDKNNSQQFDPQIGNWISTCYVIDGVDTWLTTEYQFAKDSVFQIGRFYMDDKCTITSSHANLDTPTKVEGHYDFIKNASTVTGEEVKIFSFIFYAPVTSGAGNSTQNIGIYIKDNILYFVGEIESNKYRIILENPYKRVNP